MLTLNKHALTAENLVYNEMFEIIRLKIMFLHRAHKKQAEFRGFSMIDNKVSLYHALLVVIMHVRTLVQTNTKTAAEILEEVEWTSIRKALMLCDIPVVPQLLEYLEVDPITIDEVNNEIIEDLLNTQINPTWEINTNPEGDENWETIAIAING